MSSLGDVRFKLGTQAKYDSLVSENKIEENVLYFITDTLRIYKGLDSYTGSIRMDLVESLPFTDDAVIGTLYVNKSNGKFYYFNEKSMYEEISDRPVIQSFTEVPTPIEIFNNHEKRYLNTTSDSATIKFMESVSTTTEFYSSVMIGISTSSTLAEFFTIDSDSTIDKIVYLNESLDLTDKKYLECLFFYNGDCMCCIGYAYSTTTE